MGRVKIFLKKQNLDFFVTGVKMFKRKIKMP